jgi:photosystem II stability/assembly factor-like uncharacterized protein
MSLIKWILIVLIGVFLLAGLTVADIFIPTPHRTLIFVNRQTGFVIGDGSLYRSDDGGITWKCLTESVPGHGYFAPRDGFFLSEKQGWLVSGARILATRDGGMSWQDISPPQRSLAKPDCYESHLRIRFLTPLIGWVVGAGEREGSCQDLSYVLRTRDGGRNWQRIFFDWRPFPTGDLLFDFHFWGSQRGWAVGYAGIYATGDGGEKWRLQSEVPMGRRPHDWPTIGFVDSSWGWAKANGQVMYTHNGGRTWAVDDFLLDRVYVRTALFLNKTTGLVSGDDFLLRTGDGGKSWRRVGEGGVVFKMSFLDETTGWAIDSDLKRSFRVVKTEDGGISWITICPRSDQTPCASQSPNMR